MASVFDSTQCNSLNCEKLRRDGHRLFLCGRCGLTTYCSKKCQAEHWKLHKPICKQRGRVGPNSIDAQLGTLCTTWLKMHRPTIATALFHSLDLPRHPSAIRERALFITVERSMDLGAELSNQAAQGRGFVLKRVSHVDRSLLISLANSDPFWKRYADHWQREEEEMGNAGYWATGLVVLRMDPDSYARALPFTLDYETAMELPNPFWEMELKRRINGGIGPEEYLRPSRKKQT